MPMIQTRLDPDQNIYLINVDARLHHDFAAHAKLADCQTIPTLRNDSNTQAAVADDLYSVGHGIGHQSPTTLNAPTIV
jgi:hypothetical protein